MGNSTSAPASPSVTPPANGSSLSDGDGMSALLAGLDAPETSRQAAALIAKEREAPQTPVKGKFAISDDYSKSDIIKTKVFGIERGSSPHYSRVTDPVETINPLTGRSIYLGIRPWRCDDRFNDWLSTIISGAGWSKTKIAWRTLRKCGTSEFGEQPTVDYEVLTRREVMFYVDRHEGGMIRDYMFEKYPFSTRDLGRVNMEDSVKMRVWRHQRELELEAKSGRVEEVIADSVWSEAKSKKMNRKIVE
jgi:hypothetical protein